MAQLPSLIGEKRQVFVVDNKIDLLPKDSPHFQAHIKDSLSESLIQCGITKSNFKHIGLISASFYQFFIYIKNIFIYFLAVTYKVKQMQ